LANSEVSFELNTVESNFLGVHLLLKKYFTPSRIVKKDARYCTESISKIFD
jgi:hypothetical protein